MDLSGLPVPYPTFFAPFIQCCGMIDHEIVDMIGAELGHRYRLNSILGAGGMGAVYSAFDRLLERHVALKIPLLGRSRADDYLSLFVQEAKLLSRLSDSHFFPNLYDIILPVDVSSSFMVMELLNGKTLWAVIRHSVSPLSSSWCLEVVCQIARALAVLHDRGIVHQDIKPRNVFLTREGGGLDFVKLLDLGVSVSKQKLRASGEPASSAAGTRAYMAPEVLSERKVSEQADIYSLGVLILEFFMADYPYQPASHEKNLLDLVTDPSALPSSEKSARLPRTMWSCLKRMLSADPTMRPSAAECVREMQAGMATWD